METIEEKAKAYDEALKWIRELYPGLHGATKEDAEHYFPQLRKSKNERMAELAIKAVRSPQAQSCIKSWGVDPDDVIAWLEKQKEQKHADKEQDSIAFLEQHGYTIVPPHAPVSIVPSSEATFTESSEEDEKIRKELVEYLTVTRQSDFVSRPDRQRWIEYLEKQKEQKPISFNEPYNPDEYEVVIEGNATSLRRKEQKPIKVYRVENEKEQKGLWRKFDGTWEPLFNMLTDGLCRNLPMEDNDLYRAEGKKWFASAPSRETLQKWFSKRDLEELTAAGFTISEFEVTNYKKVSEFEYIFTRDSIINRTYLTVSDIYPEQKSAWNEEDEKIMYYVYEAVQTRYSDRELSKYLDPKIIGDKIELRRKIFAFLRNLRPSCKTNEQDKEMKLKILKYLSTRCSVEQFEEVEEWLNNKLK